MGRPCEVCCNLQVAGGFDKSKSHPLALKSGMQILVRGTEDFRKSGDGGCTTCAFAFKSLLHFGFSPESSFRIIIRVHAHGACDLTTEDFTMQLYTPLGYAPAWEGISQSSELSLVSGSQQALRFISACLSECDVKHLSCKRPTLELPTRLIDVELPREDEVRLIETPGMPNIPYVALSYCWGKGGSLTTTKANIHAMKDGILMTRFPQTLQDAVAVTRALKVRYIWVDAICIIQDSITDWEIESSKMATVYQNAYLTIAAGTAADATEGFLHRQHLVADHERPYHSDWQNSNGDKTILGARIIPSSESHTLDQVEEDSIPLTLRGWTLQEDILSTRILTFARDELWWACQTQQCCECHSMDSYHNAERFLTIAHPRDAFERWQTTVEQFSVRALTNLQDKLPALSGIAKVIQDITGSPYIAGLWADNMVLDLTWSSGAFLNENIRTMPNSRLAEYRAPTFSWVSVEQSFSFDHGHFISRSRIPPGKWVPAGTLVEARSAAVGQNPLGRVQSGFITLNGLVIETTLQVRVNKILGELYEIAVDQVVNSFTPDTRLEEFEGINEDGVLEKSVRRSPFESTSRSAESGAPVFLFHLGDWHSTEREVGRRNYLVLGRCPYDLRKFERLGLHQQDFSLSAPVLERRDSALMRTVTLL